MSTKQIQQRLDLISSQSVPAGSTSLMASKTAEPYIPLGGDGYNKDGQATASCYCGTVQLAFPTSGDGFVDSFVCNCSDCRKVTASMFASNFIIKDSHLSHNRGQDKLTRWAHNRTIETGNEMANFFCSVCGTLMYRVSSGFPGMSILRIGTVDDFNLHENELKPRIEQFCKDRVAWLHGADGVQQENGNYYDSRKNK